jgi:hypothetical protein
MMDRIVPRHSHRGGAFLAVGVLGLLFAAAGAHATDPVPQCQSAKNKAAGSYAACRQKAEAKLASNGDVAKYTASIAKCETKFSDAWTKAETKAAAKSVACLDGAPTALPFKAVIDRHADSVAVALGGGAAVGCGNGFIEPGEQCDANNLDGATCASQGFAYGALQCSAACAFDTSGCLAVRFTDNGNGTISDALTGLMWEKKGHLDGTPVVCTSAVVCPDPHDADNLYTYSFDNPTGPPGTVFTVLLAQLNAGGGFAGHTDWRLPTLEELQPLVDYADTSNPTILSIFDSGCSASCDGITCSCTSPERTWTNDLVPSIVGNAWVVEFGDGSVLNDTRDTEYSVRAVR